MLPPLYSLIITYHTIAEKGLEKSSAMIVMSYISCLWGGRLTYQFIKKGGYTLQGEDYRWPYVKEAFGDKKFALHVFNLFFIVIYQNILLLLLVVPQLIMVGRNTKIDGLYDILITVAYLALVAIEAVSDKQQQVFQIKKYKMIAEEVERKDDFKVGFLRSGFFAYCRHPNYVCEVLLWWVFALFSVSRCGFNWTFVGALNLSFLFTGSVDITEQISLKKYPEYAEYQQDVSAFIPSLRMLTIKK